MASGQVTVSLPSIDQLMKAIGTSNIEVGVGGAASAARGKIIQNWNKGINGEGESLQEPAISDEHAKYRKSIGRKPIITFNISGDLMRSFGVKSLKYNTAILSFTADQLPKARGLMNPQYRSAAKWRTRPQALETGDKLNAIASNQFNKWLRKVVKFQ